MTEDGAAEIGVAGVGESGGGMLVGKLVTRVPVYERNREWGNSQRGRKAWELKSWIARKNRSENVLG